MVHLSQMVWWMKLGAMLALAWAPVPMPATSSNLLDLDWMWLSCQSADPVAGDHPGPRASQGQSADAREVRWHFVRDASARFDHIERHNRPHIVIPDLPSPVEHGYPPPAQACARRNTSLSQPFLGKLKVRSMFMDNGNESAYVFFCKMLQRYVNELLSAM